MKHPPERKARLGRIKFLTAWSLPYKGRNEAALFAVNDEHG